MEDAVQILQLSEDLVKLKIRKDEDNSGVLMWTCSPALLSVCSELGESHKTCKEHVKHHFIFKKIEMGEVICSFKKIKLIFRIAMYLDVFDF